MKIKTVLLLVFAAFLSMALISSASMYYISAKAEKFQKSAELSQEWLKTYFKLQTGAVTAIKEIVELISALENDDDRNHANILQFSNLFETSLKNLQYLRVEELKRSQASTWWNNSNASGASREAWHSNLKATEEIGKALSSRFQSLLVAIKENKKISIESLNQLESQYEKDLLPLINDSIATEYDHLSATKKKIERFHRQTKVWFIACNIVWMLFLIVLLRWLFRTIFVGLKDLSNAVEAMKTGNFAPILATGSRHEFDELKEVFNSMTRTIREQQAQLANASKMSALGEMAGGMAHEINNPLGTINLRAIHLQRLLEKFMQDPSTINEEGDRARKYAEIILNTGNRIAKIVSGMRTFARMGDADPFQMEDFNNILQETLALCSARILANSIELEQNIEAGLFIYCRPVQVSQLLLNIISNAAYELKQVDDRPRKISIDASKQGNRALILITDNGRGIPKNIIEKVKEPFFTTKPPGEGTGLGLSISQGIIDSHKGAIDIESEAGRTCFTIMLRTSPFEKVSS